MNEFEIFNETEKQIAELDVIKEVINYALNYEQVHDAEFNIIIVDNQKIRKINKEYRHIDAETDVISFALEDEKDFVDIGRRILGDIYISLDKAESQALEYGHSLLRELCFLTVHGLLHLLGYDHMIEAEEKVMFEHQKEILDGYGIKRDKKKQE